MGIEALFYQGQWPNNKVLLGRKALQLPQAWGYWNKEEAWERMLDYWSGNANTFSLWGHRENKIFWFWKFLHAAFIFLSFVLLLQAFAMELCLPPCSPSPREGFWRLKKVKVKPCPTLYILGRSPAPRWHRVSHISGRRFTIWATREALWRLGPCKVCFNLLHLKPSAIIKHLSEGIKLAL